MAPRVVVADEAGPVDLLQAVGRSENQVVAVGAKGLVLESIDGAHTWSRHTLPGRAPLIDVTVCPDGRFFLLDFRRGLWRRGANGGAWGRSPIAVSAEEDFAPRSLALRCDARGRLWAVGEESSILRSDDRGEHWRSMHPDRTDRLLTAIGFVDAEKVRVLGEFGTSFVSDDAGKRWRRGPDIPGELYTHAAHVAADETIWAVGATGHVYRLDDGSDNWVAEASGTTRALYGVTAVGPRLIAVGAGGGALTRAESWAALALHRRAGVAWAWRGVVALGADVFVAVGEAGAMRVELPPVDSAKRGDASDDLAAAEAP